MRSECRPHRPLLLTRLAYALRDLYSCKYLVGPRSCARKALHRLFPSGESHPKSLPNWDRSRSSYRLRSSNCLSHTQYASLPMLGANPAQRHSVGNHRDLSCSSSVHRLLHIVGRGTDVHTVILPTADDSRAIHTFHPL